MDFILACRVLTQSCTKLEELRFLGTDKFRVGRFPARDAVERLRVGGGESVVLWVWEVLSKVMDDGLVPGFHRRGIPF